MMAYLRGENPFGRRHRGKSIGYKTFGTGSQYNVLFGMLMLPILAAVSKPRIFEIGLGCGMPGGPGQSVEVWHELYPSMTLWVAEYEKDCAIKWYKDLRWKRSGEANSFGIR